MLKKHALKVLTAGSLLHLIKFFLLLVLKLPLAFQWVWNLPFIPRFCDHHCHILFLIFSSKRPRPAVAFHACELFYRYFFPFFKQYLFENVYRGDWPVLWLLPHCCDILGWRPLRLGRGGGGQARPSLCHTGHRLSKTGTILNRRVQKVSYIQSQICFKL